MEILGYNANGDIEITVEGVPMTVPDVVGNRERAEIAAWEFDREGNRVNTIPAYLPPDTSEMPYRLYKSVFISRLTSDEAVTMEGVLEAADAKLRLMFNSVEYFISDDPLFDTLAAAVGEALGSERAAQLLGPN